MLMKKTNYSRLICFLLWIVSLSGNIHGQLPEDFVKKYNRFIELNVGVHALNVQNRALFYVGSQIQENYYNDNYRWNSSVALHFGTINQQDTSRLKKYMLYSITGFEWSNKSAVLTVQNNQSSEVLIRTDHQITLPFVLGIRSPIKYNTIKNGFYRVVDLRFGATFGISAFNSSRSTASVSRSFDFVPFHLVRLGWRTDVGLSFLNMNGHGHRFGFQVNADLTSMRFINISNSKLPFYYSLGLNYNIINSYKNKLRIKK